MPTGRSCRGTDESAGSEVQANRPSPASDDSAAAHPPSGKQAERWSVHEVGQRVILVSSRSGQVLGTIVENEDGIIGVKVWVFKGEITRKEAAGDEIQA